MVMENFSSEIHCVFVETNMDTRFMVQLNKDENVSVFKEKLSKQHSQCFPEAGDVTISVLKVERNGHFYHLPDSMNVSMAFGSNSEKGWFLFVDAAVIVDKGKLMDAVGSNLNADKLLENKTEVLEAEAAEEKKARKRKRKRRRKRSSHESLKLCEKVEVEVGPESGAVGNDIEVGGKDFINIGESGQTCPNHEEVLEKEADAEETSEAAEEKTKQSKVKGSDAEKRNNSDASHKSCEHVKVEVATESGAIEQGREETADASILAAYRKLFQSAERLNTKLEALRFEILLNEKLLSQLLQSHPKPVEKPLKKVPGEPFVPLTKEEEAEVYRAFSGKNRRNVLATHANSNIDITGEVLQCLTPSSWLNDEVINVYLELLKERETREPKKYFKCHFFNTFFYKKLVSDSGYNFQAVSRWTTQRKLGYALIDCDMIFVPIHRGVHWTLAVINNRDQKFLYLDSLNGDDSKILNALAKYLGDEAQEKSGKNIDVSSWDMECVEDIPQQQNGYDCGMFMLKYIDFFSRDVGLCFSQEHMPYFRLRTAKEILRLRAD